MANFFSGFHKHSRALIIDNDGGIDFFLDLQTKTTHLSPQNTHEMNIFLIILALSS